MVAAGRYAEYATACDTVDLSVTWDFGNYSLKAACLNRTAAVVAEAAVGGLDLHEWAFCMLCGVAVLGWQQLVNMASRLIKRIQTGGGSHESGLLKFKSGTGNGMIRMRGTSKSVDVKKMKSDSAARRMHGQMVQKRLSRGPPV